MDLTSDCKKRLTAIKARLVPSDELLHLSEDLHKHHQEILIRELSGQGDYHTFHEFAFQVEQLLDEEKYTEAALYVDSLERLLFSLQLTGGQ